MKRGTKLKPPKMFGNAGTSFEGPWRALAEAYGGVTALADEIGAPYPTLYRWAVGRQTPPS